MGKDLCDTYGYVFGQAYQIRVVPALKTKARDAKEVVAYCEENESEMRSPRAQTRCLGRRYLYVSEEKTQAKRKELKNYKVEPFNDQDNKPFLSKCHNIVYSRDGTAYLRRRRCDGCKPCTESPPRFLECERVNECGPWYKVQLEKKKEIARVIAEGKSMFVPFLLDSIFSR